MFFRQREYIHDKRFIFSSSGQRNACHLGQDAKPPETRVRRTTRQRGFRVRVRPPKASRRSPHASAMCFGRQPSPRSRNLPRRTAPGPATVLPPTFRPGITMVTFPSAEPRLLYHADESCQRRRPSDPASQVGRRLGWGQIQMMILASFSPNGSSSWILALGFFSRLFRYERLEAIRVLGISFLHYILNVKYEMNS